MKMNIVTVLAMALLVAACGERVSSRATEAPAPEIAPPVARHQSALVPAAAQGAPAEERAQRAAPDFKDSAGSLDRSK